MTLNRDRILAATILGVFSILSLLWFGRYLNYSAVVSVDLPGHVALIQRLGEQLLHGRLFFYDTWWFGGWSVYQFYGFFAHLFTAFLLPLTGMLSPDPALLAVHLVLLIGCAALPCSVYLAARVLQSGEDLGGDGYPVASMTALLSCVFTFWFLNQPLDFFGIGAGSLWNGGLYTQIFAWHLSAFIWAGLFSISKIANAKTLCVTAILFSVLICTNIFAAVFSGFIFIATFLRFSKARSAILLLLLISFGLSCFWWLPMVMTASDYTINHSEPPEGDFLGLLIRQPLAQFFMQIKKLFSGVFVPVELAPLIAGLIVLASISSPRFWRLERSVANLLIALLALILFSSHYIAESLPLGLHYYRFTSFILFYLIILIVSNGVHLYHVAEDLILRTKAYRIFRSSVAIFCILSLSMTFAIGILRERVVDKSAERSSNKSQQKVLAALNIGVGKGRVAFEYFRDRAIFSFLSPHYLESQLASRTGRETIQGLFIQSSLSTQFAAQSLKSFGFDAYRIPPLWGDDALLPADLALEQLKDFNVGAVVAVNKKATQLLSEQVGASVVTIDPYQIVSFPESKAATLDPIFKKIIAYRDRAGGLPFKYLESVFYNSPELYRRTHLIELLSKADAAPSGAIVLVHGDKLNEEEIAIQLPRGILNRSLLEADQEKHLYQALATLINREILAQLLLKAQIANTIAEPLILKPFSAHSQEFTLASLKPGIPYALPYSYSPYFSALGGKLYRGIREGMVIVSGGDQMVLRFSRLTDPTCFFSLCVSLFTVFALVLFMFSVMLKRKRVHQ